MRRTPSQANPGPRSGSSAGIDSTADQTIEITIQSSQPGLPWTIGCDAHDACERGPCRRPAPAEPDALLEPTRIRFFVPVKLVNAKNERKHWSERSRRAGRHRDATALAVYTLFNSDPRYRIGRRELPAWMTTPSQAKRIHVRARVWSLFDSIDGLRVACSHVVDGLADAHLIGQGASYIGKGGRAVRGSAHDADAYGHVFTYDQVIDRARLGALVTVEPLPLCRS